MTTAIYDSLSDFTTGSFTYQGKTKPLYRKGSGPGVVIIHEIPGITPQVADFARRVVDAGFTTVLPVLFGTPGKPMTVGYTVGVIARVCISNEFACFAAKRSSPVTDWLRALCRQVHAECGGPGVGALGNGIPQSAHSVLTAHYNDAEGHPTRDAFDRVLTHFRERLQGS